MFGIAALHGSAEPQMIAVPEPGSPGPGEVLCRTLELGVCGTDREILLSRDPWTRPGDDHLVLGHECLARIEQVGSGVTAFASGDLVVPVVRRALSPTPRPDLLPFGEYVERGIVNEAGFSTPLWLDRPEHLFRVDPRISSLAVFTEPLSVAEKGANEALALQQGRLGEDAWVTTPPRVLVTGMGPIGFAAVIACCCRNWPVTMYGRDESNSFRAMLAQGFGASYVAQHEFDFSPADVENDGFDLVIECTGSDELTMACCDVLASCGVMVWLGSSRVPEARPHNIDLVMRNALLRNHVFVGSVNAAPRDFSDALEHLAQLQATHAEQLAALFTARVSPAESLWHYQNREPQGIKTILVYD